MHDKCTLIVISVIWKLFWSSLTSKMLSHTSKVTRILSKTFSDEEAVELCHGKYFDMAQIPSCLKSETAKFVLDWNSDNTTLNNIHDMLAVSLKKLAKSIEINVIKKSNSITVICIFPFYLLV